MANILELEFESTDLDQTVTIREFFGILMRTLWEEKENFSGKHPFGNSSWDSDLICCLIKNKLVTGSLDGYGDIADYNQDEVDKFVLLKIINPLFGLS